MKQPGIRLFIFLFLYPCFVQAQGYQALNGSPYTGSTAVFNNPAASVQSAYQWDLSLLSLQLKLSSNSVYIDSSGLRFRQGVSSHFIHANIDLSFFNFLYKIDNTKAVNFNIRARTYNHVKTLPVNIDDTISSIHSFLTTNRNTPYVQGFVTHSGWLEGDLNYSQVLLENSTSKLSGGVTLQIMKGISGAYIKVNKLSFLEAKNATDTTYTFTNGGGAFGYSDNYDGGTGNTFLSKAKLGLGMSLGIEYLIYSDLNASTGNNNLNYSWKIGVSLMDIGSNTFATSANSSQFNQPISTVPDNTIDGKINNPSSLQSLKDSLATLFVSSSSLTGNFSVSNPTRLIINVDKNLGDHFYVNSEMSLNFYSTSDPTRLHTRELNLLTVTPRWETIGWGAYMPVQYNTQGQLWVGAALKLGPLVLGVHNLGVFKKYPELNGGGYLLLSIHPFNRAKVLSKMDCPR